MNLTLQQRDVFNDTSKKIAVKAGRRTGKTYLAIEYAKAFAQAFPGSTILLRGRNHRHSHDMIREIEIGEELELANGSLITMYPSSTRMSRSFDLVILDEAAVLSDMDIRNACRNTTSNTRFLMLSSKWPRSNTFYTDAFSTTSDWSQHLWSTPDIIFSDGARFVSDEELNRIKNNIGIKIFEAEFLVE